MEEIEELAMMTRQLTESIVSDVIKKRNEAVNQYILLNATPKIKGELTKGKVKWRGIKIVVNSFNDWQVWQRNEPISPVIKIG